MLLNWIMVDAWTEERRKPSIEEVAPLDG